MNDYTSDKKDLLPTLSLDRREKKFPQFANDARNRQARIMGRIALENDSTSLKLRNRKQLSIPSDSHNHWYLPML